VVPVLVAIRDQAAAVLESVGQMVVAFQVQHHQLEKATLVAFRLYLPQVAQAVAVVAVAQARQVQLDQRQAVAQAVMVAQVVHHQ
jgi:hypothetical protein